ncbi:MAG TPA: ABC transporter permease [Terriglobia bacterium]|nr:ABC transporter permease [Terriglobia bacterium]
MNTLLSDLRYALRMLRKNPGFAAVALLTLALGIGANTAIFSVIDAVLLNRLPYHDPSRLVLVWEQNPRRGWFHNIVSGANFKDWRSQNDVFTAMAAIDERNFDVSGNGEPVEVEGEQVTANYFTVLGVGPALGRTFTPDEDQPGRAPVVVLSDGLWKRRYGGDPALVGHDITVNREKFNVIGIMPPGFFVTTPFGDRAEIWFAGLDLATPPDRTWHEHLAIGRLRPSVTLQQAQTEMDAIALRLGKQYPEQSGWGVKLVGLHDELVGNTRPALMILLAAVGVVLLIACANLEALQLARVAAREREIAVRSALGAGRGRVVRQLITENLLLAVAGGGLGLLLASWGVRFLVALAPQDTPGLATAGVNWGVLGFTLAVSLAAGVAFGLVPALTAARVDLNETLKESGRSSTEGTRTRRRLGLLVSWELALALVLLVGAGLLIKTFVALNRVDMGIDPHHVITMRVALLGPRYAERGRQADFFRQLLQKVEALPGVESAAAIDGGGLPPDGGNGNDFLIVGRPAPPSNELPDAVNRVVSPDYFRTMGISLVRGRYFAEADNESAPRVAIIDERLARDFWPGRDPIGSQVTFPNIEKLTQPNGTPKEPTRFTIVGVVKDVKNRGLEVPADEEIYVLYNQGPVYSMPRTLVVKTLVEPTSIVSAVRDQVTALDADQPIADVATMKEIVTQAHAGQRFLMILLGLFAGLALILAAVGTYGVMSYGVSQRMHEIGIRMALGAEHSDVRSLVMRRGLTLATWGIVMGLIAAFSLTWLMSRLLFGVHPTDLLTFIVGTVVLLGAALLGSYVPACRATRADPMVALRHQ